MSQAPSPPCLQGLRLLSDKTAAAIGRFQGKCEETEILSSMGTAQPCECRAAVGQAHVLAWRNTLRPTCCPAIAFAPLPWHLGPQCVVPTCPQCEEPKLHRPCPAPALTAPTPSADLPWLPNATALPPFMAGCTHSPLRASLTDLHLGASRTRGHPTACLGPCGIPTLPLRELPAPAPCQPPHPLPVRAGRHLDKPHLGYFVLFKNIIPSLKL